MSRQPSILEHAARLRLAGEPFALATVVRTVAATAAKAGAKAIIRADGAGADGGRGGGGARGAGPTAEKPALPAGPPRLVSVQPDEELAGHGVSAGSVREGVRYARNMCPSKGTMDIFVEPVLPMPQLAILGASPVAVALCDLAPRFGFRTLACAPAADQNAFAAADERIEGYLLPAQSPGQRLVIVCTQGRGDEAALKAALQVEALHVAFVGSRAKAAALRQTLLADGVPEDAFDRLKAPAGLDIGAITPEEIALSILAEMIEVRRRGQRAPGGRP